MGLKNLQIIFDDPTAVFEPGQTVTGRVLVVANDSVKIKKIKLKFKGEGRVHWEQTETRTNSKNESEDYVDDYKASEEYLNHKIVLEGDKEDDRTFELEGEHIYPFSVTLPLQLPSTFKEEYGSVQYKAIVKIVIPWSLNKSKEITFEIRSPINLNDEPSLAEPKIQETEKFFCCCCCKSGPLTMVVYVPYCGFVPGQSIPVTVEIDNNTNTDVDTMKIRLDRIIEFKAHSPFSKTKSKLIKINNKYLIGTKKHTSKTWTEHLIVPDRLIVTNLKHCGIISDTYFVNVEVCVKGVHGNKIASIGLTLGDVPLTVARNPPQYGHSFQASNQSYTRPEQTCPNDSCAPIGFVETSPLPGYAQQITLHADGQQSASPAIHSSFRRTECEKVISNQNRPPPYQISDPETTPKSNQQEVSSDLQVKY